MLKGWEKGVVKEYLIGGRGWTLEGTALEKSVGEGWWLTTHVSPVGWNPLPFCIGGRRVGGGRIGAEGRQVGEKAQEKHLMTRGIGIGLETIEVRNRDGCRLSLGTGRR